MAVERKISGVLYRFEELVGWDAFDALDLLIEIVGPLVPLLQAVEDDKGGEGVVGEGAELLAPKVRKPQADFFETLPRVLKNHNSAAMRELFKRLIVGCKAGNEPAVIGVKPQSLDEMFQVFAFCVEGQFGPFFKGEGVGALLALVGNKKKRAA